MREKSPTETEKWKQALHDAGTVECSVCGVKYGQGKKGLALSVCIECLEYLCDEHMWRHPKCSEGR